MGGENMKKFISILLSVMLLSAMYLPAVLAWDTIQPDNGGVGKTGIGNATNTILGFVQFVGYAIAIGMLIYIGIKYATASANEKADLKSMSVKYVIGAVLIAGATAVAGWFFTLGQNISGQET